MKTVKTIEEAFDTEFISMVNSRAVDAGYKLNYCWKVDNFLRFRVSPIDRFTPSIYEDEDWSGNISFSMQTTSYGSLDGEELDQFIRQVNNGAAFTKFLNGLDWSLCPVLELNK